MVYKGRKTIVSNYSTKDLNPSVVAEVITKAMLVHDTNAKEIDYLLNYFKGEQPILQRTKLVREDINNQVVLNSAWQFTRMITGYFLGEPMKYVPKKQETANDVQDFSEMLEDKNKHLFDLDNAETSSICGISYRFNGKDAEDKENPLSITTLDPRNTFIVYGDGVFNNKLLSCYFVDTEKDGSVIRQYFAYSKTKLYKFIVSGGSIGEITVNDFISEEIHYLGANPIVEYPNNKWLMGDWEVAISIFDAINELESNRVDDVGQFVQAFFKFLNCEIDEVDFARFKQLGVIFVDSIPGAPNPEVEQITHTLDQSQVQVLADNLYSKACEIVGIPDRKQRSGNGDTGQAVALRDGWADLETMARNKEQYFKKADREFLKVAINILDKKASVKHTDLRQKMVRNKNDNMLVKSQSYSTLRSSGMNDTDALTFTEIVSDPHETFLKNQQEKQEAMKQAQEQMMQQQAVKEQSNKNNNTTTSKTE